MTSKDYTVAVTLTPGQLKSIAIAGNNSTSLRLLIKRANMSGNHKLFMSDHQSAKSIGKGVIFMLSSAHVKKSIKHAGVLPLLGMLTPVLGPILGTLGSAVIDKIAENGLKKGSGLRLAPYPR
ncbi:hypothetical protein CHS0354_013725, partial [Potamilus streckersoni]